jgi:putative intracellular protease/amidase
MNLKKYFFLVITSLIFSCAFSQDKKVYFYLFDGAQIIDFAGPMEVLGYGFEVHTVSKNSGVVTTNMGLKVTTDYNFSNCPAPEILVIPGGNSVWKHISENPDVVTWIKDKSKSAEIVMSVCNGAFFLAKAGLLENLTVTTTAGFIDTLQYLVPSAKAVRDKRYVDNGKIITTAGLSSGIDGSLHIVSRLLGKGWEPIFARWLEYEYKPTSTYTAASLADNNTTKIMRFLLWSLNGTPVKVEGDQKKFESEIVIVSKSSQQELLNQVNDTLLKKEKWTRKEYDQKSGTSKWSFVGVDKNNWNGKVDIVPLDKPETFKVTVSIVRV